MLKAVWNGTVLAESDNTEVVDGIHYFPPESINRQYFKPSETHTTCPWKGKARYYDLAVNGKTNQGAAWYYPKPNPAAIKIRGYVAFWKGVRLESGRGRARSRLLDWLSL